MLSATQGPMPHHSTHAQPSGEPVQYMLNGTGIHLAEHARQDTSNTHVYIHVCIASVLPHMLTHMYTGTIKHNTCCLERT